MTRSIGPYELNRVHLGRSPECLKAIPDGTVHTCITSPPYYGLRDYKTAKWEGGDPKCDHDVQRWGGPKQTQGAQSGHASKADRLDRQECTKCGARRVDFQIGLEQTPDEYISQLVEVFREVRRVLHPTGTFWLNLGDCYANDTKWGGSSGGKHAKDLHGNPGGMGREKRSTGLKAKDLVMIPARVALALQADGWYLRSQIPWVKRNAMPESTADRPSSAVEYVYLFSKEKDYYFDMEAVKVPCSDNPVSEARRNRADFGTVGTKAIQGSWFGQSGKGKNSGTRSWPGIGPKHGGERNRGEEYKPMEGGSLRQRRNSDWFFESWQGLWVEDEEPIAFIVNPKACSDAHFATFPSKLVEPMILAGTSEKGCCPKCGAPWGRKVESVPSVSKECPKTQAAHEARGGTGKPVGTVGKSGSGRIEGYTTTLGWQPTCNCPGLDGDHPGSDCAEEDNWPRVPCIVLDPFAGTGTTVVTAMALGREGIGFDISEEYVGKIAKVKVEAAKKGFTTAEVRAGQKSLFEEGS